MQVGQGHIGVPIQGQEDLLLHLAAGSSGLVRVEQEMVGENHFVRMCPRYPGSLEEIVNASINKPLDCFKRVKAFFQTAEGFVGGAVLLLTSLFIRPALLVKIAVVGEFSALCHLAKAVYKFVTGRFGEAWKNFKEFGKDLYHYPMMFIKTTLSIVPIVGTGIARLLPTSG